MAFKGSYCILLKAFEKEWTLWTPAGMIACMVAGALSFRIDFGVLVAKI